MGNAFPEVHEMISAATSTTTSSEVYFNRHLDESGLMQVSFSVGGTYGCELQSNPFGDGRWCLVAYKNHSNGDTIVAVPIDHHMRIVINSFSGGATVSVWLMA